MEICASSLPYIDFTAPSVDYRGRVIYEHSSNNFRCVDASSLTVRMQLNSTGLYVGGSLVSSSDKKEVQ